MGYAEKNLVAGESVLYRARYHWVVYRTSLLLFLLGVLVGAASLYARRTSPGSGVALPVGLLAVVFLFLGLVLWIARRIRVGADEFVVTSRRVIRRVGLVSREIEQAPLEKIQDITVQQGAIGRMLDFGTVVLETASERGTLLFPGIAHPEAFRNAVWGHLPAGGSGPAVAPRAVTASSSSVPARQRLAELENLKQQGLVSDDEYAVKRKEILSTL